MSLEKIKRNAETAGAKATYLSDEALKKIAERNAEYKREMNRLLDEAYTRDKHFVEGSRRNRIGNRASRRKK